MENQTEKCGILYIRPDDLAKLHRGKQVVACFGKMPEGIELKDFPSTWVVGKATNETEDARFYGGVLLQKNNDVDPVIDLWMLSSQIAELATGREAKATTCQRPTDSTIIHGIPLSWVKLAGDNLRGEVFIQKPQS